MKELPYKGSLYLSIYLNYKTLLYMELNLTALFFPMVSVLL